MLNTRLTHSRYPYYTRSVENLPTLNSGGLGDTVGNKFVIILPTFVVIPIALHVLKLQPKI